VRGVWQGLLINTQSDRGGDAENAATGSGGLWKRDSDAATVARGRENRKGQGQGRKKSEPVKTIGVAGALRIGARIRATGRGLRLTIEAVAKEMDVELPGRQKLLDGMAMVSDLVSQFYTIISTERAKTFNSLISCHEIAGYLKLICLCSGYVFYEVALINICAHDGQGVYKVGHT